MNFFIVLPSYSNLFSSSIFTNFSSSFLNSFLIAVKTPLLIHILILLLPTSPRYSSSKRLLILLTHMITPTRSALLLLPSLSLSLYIVHMLLQILRLLTRFYQMLVALPPPCLLLLYLCFLLSTLLVLQFILGAVL